MTERILFLDIDGPLIPGRAALLPNQTAPYWHIFDPVAVSLINDACRHQGRKIVVHSSWVKHTDLYEFDLLEHLIGQGLDASLFHEDPICKPIAWRYDRIKEWLSRHEIDDYVILDDEAPQILDPKGFHDHLLQVDYEDGVTWKIYRKLKDGNWNV